MRVSRALQEVQAAQQRAEHSVLETQGFSRQAKDKQKLASKLQAEFSEVQERFEVCRHLPVLLNIGSVHDQYF